MNNVLNKKTWYKHLVNGLVAIALFSACSDEFGTTTPNPLNPGEGGVTRTLSMNFFPEEAAAFSESTITRAATPIVDNFVDDIWVLVYDDSGDFLESVYAIPVQTAGAGGRDYWNANLDITTEFDTPVYVYCLANTHDKEMFTSKSALDFSTMAKLKTLAMPAPLKPATGHATMLNSPDGVTPARPSLLMRGVGRNLPDADKGEVDVIPALNDAPGLIPLKNSLQVQLYRLVSRISFTLDNQSAHVYPDSLRVCNVPANLAYFKTDTELAAEAAGTAPTYISYAATANTGDVNTGLDGTTHTWYIPRNIMATGAEGAANPAASTYVEVSGHAIDPNNQSKLGRVYRFYPHQYIAAVGGDTPTPASYNFNLDGNQAFEYDAEITGFKLSSLAQYTHWSVNSSSFILPSDANCIFVPTAHYESKNNGYCYAFDIAPQIAAYHAYANTRNLTPKTLLTASDAWYAEILWMDGQTLVELDADRSTGVGLTGEVHFSLPGGKAVSGNALVAIKKKSNNNVIWSWHLWIMPYTGLDYLPATTYTPKNSHANYVDAGYMNYKQFTMLDYNLGATQTGKPTAAVTNGNGHPTFGLYYQWGRKDPFPQTGALGAAATGYYKGDGSAYTHPALYTPTGTAHLSYSLLNPNTFIWYSSTSNYWAGSDGTLSWGGHDGGSTYGSNGATVSSVANIKYYFIENDKTPFDPCPVGYRVPPPGAFDYDYYATTAAGFSAPFSFGFDWTTAGGPVPSVFPASGYRDRSTGVVTNQGAHGYFWASAPSTAAYGFLLYFSSAYVYPRASSSRACGYGVRCSLVQ